MNSKLIILWAIAFSGYLTFAKLVDEDEPMGMTRLSSNFSQANQGEPYKASCQWAITSQQKAQQSPYDDYQLTVSFRKEFMPMINDERFPVVVEFRQNHTSNSMVFFTVHSVDGLTIKPEGGEVSELTNPMSVIITPDFHDGMHHGFGNWKCSVTLQSRNSDKSYTFTGLTYNGITWEQPTPKKGNGKKN